MSTKTVTFAVICMLLVGAVFKCGYAGEFPKSKKGSGFFVDAEGDAICDNRNARTNTCQVGEGLCRCQGKGQSKDQVKRPCGGQGTTCKGRGQVRGNGKNDVKGAGELST